MRYDEVFGPDEIRHAFRMTVHGVNGYVWPASHRADTNPSGPPLGARMRLKPGTNISGYPAYVQKIFRAMKTYGLIVADTGSDMYIGGAFDTRWNNGQLNPAFSAIKASDFEFIQLGWRGNTGPCTLPDAPSGLGAATSGLNVTFTWSAPSSGAPVTDYLLEAGSASGASDLATVPVAASSTSYSATAPAGTYYVRVRARNGCGGAVSNEVVVPLAPSCTAPGVPGAPVATVNGSTVSLSWTPASGATSHVFEAGSVPGLSNLVNTEMAATTLSAQAPPGVYHVRTRGRNACGTSSPSPEAVVAVGGCSAPSSASPLGYSLNGRQVTLTWTAASGATDYVVEAGTSSGAANVASIPVGGTTLTATAPPATYFVRVRPRNACGSGAWSNEVEVNVQ